MMADELGGTSKIEKLNDDNFHALKQTIGLILPRMIWKATSRVTHQLTTLNSLCR